MPFAAADDEERAGPDRRWRRRGPDRVDAAGRARASSICSSARARRPRICRRRTSSTSGRWRCSTTSASRTRSRSAARPPSRWRRRRSTPASPAPTPTTGAALARLECWGAGGADESWRAASPWRQLNLPQIRLEPLMKARAEELSPGRIRFNHELDRARAGRRRRPRPIRDNGSGREYRGAQRVPPRRRRRAAGRRPDRGGVRGPRRHRAEATLHVSADFSRWRRTPTSSSAGSSRRRPASSS